NVPYRFVHAIEASLPGGQVGIFIGVTIVDPAAKTIHSILLTQEGFILFDAQYAQSLKVNRALPPFNAEHLAGYIMEDVRLVFLAPEGAPADVSVLEDGSAICRYPRTQNMIEDIIIYPDGAWSIKLYRRPHEQLREVDAHSMKNGFPEMLELSGFESRNYSLRMKLISAEPVSAEVFPLLPGEAPDDE
ncbi:MAG: hypothetical protein ABSB79_04990, partial [Syntrophales bacterium]